MKKLLLSLFLSLSLCCAVNVGSAEAATLISTASGNIDATATWSVVDTTGTNAYLNSETANTALTTSPVASSPFTPAAETVTQIGVKLASVAASPSGTLTVKLANSTSPGTRECTLTVNVADLITVSASPAAASTADGGWVILACSASPNGTDNYTIQASTSVGSQVNLFSLATTNWSRLLVTSGTQTGGPAAGDKFIVNGKLTGAGTHSAFVVTIETTALVNYGNVANTLVDPSISIGQYGTLQFANAASTNYVSEFAGPMVVYNGGIFSVGTSGSPIPASSSATLTLNATVEGDTGINVRNGGTFNSAGSSGGRSVTKTVLAASATGGSTSTLTTADNTGWLSGDSIVIAGTDVTGSDSTSHWDVATLSGNASAASVPLTAAVSHNHLGQVVAYTSASTGIAYSMPMQAAVIVLNRNVIIQGSGATTNGYLYFQANSVGAMTWTEFTMISGTAAGKRGLEVDTGPLGSFSLTFASFVNTQDNTIYLAPTNANFGGGNGTYLLLQHIVMYNTGNSATSQPGSVWFNTSTKNPWWKIDDLTILRSGYNAGWPLEMAAGNGQLTNVTISGSGAGGIHPILLNLDYNSTANVGVTNTWGPFHLYANTGQAGFTNGSYPVSGKISGFYIWHEGGRFVPSNNGQLTLDPFYEIEVPFGIYNPTGGADLYLRNGIIGFDNNDGSAALTVDASNNKFTFENMEICPTGSLGGITFYQCNTTGGTMTLSLASDITPGGADTPPESTVWLRNSSIPNNEGTAYPSMRGQEAYYGPHAFITQDCAGCSPVKYAAWVPYGFLSYDSAISHTSGYSLRMTPKVITFSGYIAGQTLTVTANSPGPNVQLGTTLFSNGSGFIAGTLITGGGGPFSVSIPQTVCSAGSPCQFQSYTPLGSGRLQSAPFNQGTRVAVANGQVANACVWVRPSINTDAASTWGASAVTYNGDAPRLINRANPAMGVQSDTVLSTFAGSAGSWSQLCANLPAAPHDGEYELVVDADQTFTSNPGGSVNITEWSCTNCGNANTSQFWWNGAPANAVAQTAAPSSSGGNCNGPLAPMVPWGCCVVLFGWRRRNANDNELKRAA